MGSARKRQRFPVIDELRTLHPLWILLRQAGLSRAGYYKWKKALPYGKEADLEQHIQAIHSIRPYYGYRRMTVALHREGFSINHKRVYRVMKKLGIQAVIRRKRRSFGKKGSIVFADLLGRNFISQAPGRKLVTDITYLPTLTGFIYLSAVVDLYNNEIIAHSFSKRNDLGLVFATLRELPQLHGAILHSDQGFQYTHKAYRQKLSSLNLHGSHSRKGNCLDNASMESVFSHLKTEAFAGKELCDAQQTMDLLKEHIRFYNTERFQKRLGQLSPVEYREKLAA